MRTSPVIALLLSGWTLLSADEKPIFSCDFKSALAREWKMIGGQWEMNEACLKQTQPRPADPTKAILVTGDRDELSREVVVVAKLRLDTWADGEWARVGVSVC